MNEASLGFEIDQSDFDATYSPEDNKLRIYLTRRLDDDLFKRCKEKFYDMGFKWAPKQKLFFTPSWSPKREDFCLLIAGSIGPEETTMVERAAAKAERLEALADKRYQESNSFAAAADKISERFYMGQPILVGHHSERKARKDQQRMDSYMKKSVEARSAVNYWLYKAEGVERHANRKADPFVRVGRIKTLLADLRDRQRTINHANICQRLWTQILAKQEEEIFDALVKKYLGVHLKTGPSSPSGLWSDLNDEKITPVEAANKALEWANKTLNSPYYPRWISHILNRLGYERSELGEVERFTGKLTAAILQAFAREHGAHKPKASKTDYGWLLESDVDLPAHISEGQTLELDDDEWRQLMVSSGYEVPAPKAAQPPILNFKADSINGYRSKGWAKELATYRQIELTKKAYSAVYPDHRGVFNSGCGQFRFKICLDPTHEGPTYKADWVAVFLTDSKAHKVPESDAINNPISKEA